MILVRPLLTEKSTKGSEHKKHPVFSFEVNMDANKFDIKEEIESIYGVKVEEVRTMVARGKKHTRQTKKGVSRGKSSNYKKAVVKLKDGGTIDFYTNV